MRKVFAFFVSALICVSLASGVYADCGKVVYDGNSREFIFAPGSSLSPTDLFPEFKDVMPGDTLTQAITVKNDVSKDVKVKIYLRSLGGTEESEDFLEKLTLRVQKEDDEGAYMFDAGADLSAQLTDWVYLGTLYSGGEVDLKVTLDVPVSLDNSYKNQVGYIDWEFKVEELPVEPGDPQAPQTGDRLGFFAGVAVCSAALPIIILIKRRRGDRQTQG